VFENLLLLLLYLFRGQGGNVSLNL
jgi:hypothetical protein